MSSREEEEEEEDSGGNADSDSKSDSSSDAAAESVNAGGCHVCHVGGARALRLEPCGHTAMCKSCIKEGMSSSSLFCPLCLAEVSHWTDPDRQRKEKDEAPDVELARERAAAELARNRFKDPGVVVGEKRLGDAFGASVRGFFRQVRHMWIGLMVALLFGVPLLVTYMTSIRRSHSGTSDRGWSDESAELMRWTLLTCQIDDCRLHLEYFLLVDTSFALVAAALVATVFARPWKCELASKSLLAVQAPHRQDTMRLKSLQALFAEEQLSHIRREMQHRAPTQLVREMTPPVLRLKVTGVLNYSRHDLGFAHQAEERISLAQQVRALQMRLKKAYSKTTEHGSAQRAFDARRAKLERLEANLHDVFLQERLLGGVNIERKKRKRNNVNGADFVIITFESAAHAAFARKLLHAQDKRWSVFHHLGLVLGAPRTRFWTIGGPEDVYPGNIDWPQLQRPHRFAQSGAPARFALAMGLFLVSANVAGALLWEVLRQAHGAYAGAAVMVLWQHACRAVVIAGFRAYGHPLRSFTVFHATVVVALAVDAPSCLLWPLALTSTRSWFTLDWWMDHVLTNVVASQTAHVAFTVLWAAALRHLVRFVRILCRGRAHTQHQLDRKLRPVPWSLALAYMGALRTATVSLVFSSVVPALLPLGAIHLALLYSAEKAHLLGQCSFHGRAEPRRTALFALRCVEGSLVLRLLVSGATVHQMLQLEPVAPSSLGAISLPVLGDAVVLALLALAYVHRLRGVAWLTYNFITGREYFCFPCVWYLRRQRKRRTLERQKVAHAADPREIRFFDIKARGRHRHLFRSVFSVDELRDWKPQAEKVDAISLSSLLLDSDDDSSDDENNGGAGPRSGSSAMLSSPSSHDADSSDADSSDADSNDADSPSGSDSGAPDYLVDN